MRYSSDLRWRVLTFVENGGSKVQAAQRFGVSRASIYRWLNATDPLDYQKPGPREPRLLDYQHLEQHVAEFPDLTQQERAKHFGVSRACIGHGLQKIGCVCKKKTLGYKERCPDQRAAYCTQLAEINAR